LDMNVVSSFLFQANCIFEAHDLDQSFQTEMITTSPQYIYLLRKHLNSPAAFPNIVFTEAELDILFHSLDKLIQFDN